ncbi:MAG: C69 family dipeptidase [Candidatus Kapaibacteriales bacterium]
MNSKIFDMLTRFLYLLSICLLLSTDAFTCTNLIVAKGAGKNNSTFLTYAADAGGFMEPLFFVAARKHQPGETVDIYDWDTGKYLGKIAQAKETYKVVGNMNEYQLAIGETTFTGLDSYRDTTGIIDYGSLIRLTLQRAKTAREAIEIIDKLTTQYGYYSTGESLSLVDKNEAWIMEIHPKGIGNKGIVWVARRIPDGHIAAHANQARIREIPKNDPNTLFSKDVESFAKNQKIDKYHNDKFSFADTYNPLDPSGTLFCEGRVWRYYSLAAPSMELSEDYWRAVEGADPYPLFIKPDSKIGLDELSTWMRDHFEGTEYDMTKGLAAGPYGCPYRWKSLRWQTDSDTTRSYAWERPIGTQQTAWSMIAQMRSDLPDAIGGVFWYGPDAASTSVYMPIYTTIEEVPAPLSSGDITKFSWDVMFWSFNAVANRSYLQFSEIYSDIQKVQSYYESNFKKTQPSIEKTALELYKSGAEESARFLLSNYTTSNVIQVNSRWKELWEYITVKFNDGYMNDVTKDNGRSPKSLGYDNEFLKKVIESRPGYYDLNWKKQ